LGKFGEFPLAAANYRQLLPITAKRQSPFFAGYIFVVEINSITKN